MATPTMESYGARKQTSLILGANDHLYYQLESTMSGLDVSKILHVLGQLMKTRVKAAKAQGITRPSGLTDIEFFTLLIAVDSDLLTEGELNHALWAAENHYGGDFKGRIETVFSKMSQRLKAMEGAELPFEAVDDDHEARTAAAIKEQADKP